MALGDLWGDLVVRSWIGVVEQAPGHDPRRERALDLADH